MRCWARPGRACKSSVQQRGSQAAPCGVEWPQAVLLERLQAGSLHPCLHTAGSWCGLHGDLQSPDKASEGCLQHSLLALPPKGSATGQPFLRSQAHCWSSCCPARLVLGAKKASHFLGDSWPCLTLQKTSLAVIRPGELLIAWQPEIRPDRLSACGARRTTGGHPDFRASNTDSKVRLIMCAAAGDVLHQQNLLQSFLQHFENGSRVKRPCWRRHLPGRCASPLLDMP